MVHNDQSIQTTEGSANPTEHMEISDEFECKALHSLHCNTYDFNRVFAGLKYILVSKKMAPCALRFFSVPSDLPRKIVKQKCFPENGKFFFQPEKLFV